jgi:hypothetical protein
MINCCALSENLISKSAFGEPKKTKTIQSQLLEEDEKIQKRKFFFFSLTKLRGKG